MPAISTQNRLGILGRFCSECRSTSVRSIQNRLSFLESSMTIRRAATAARTRPGRIAHLAISQHRFLRPQVDALQLRLDVRLLGTLVLSLIHKRSRPLSRLSSSVAGTAAAARAAATCFLLGQNRQNSCSRPRASRVASHQFAVMLTTASNPHACFPPHSTHNRHAAEWQTREDVRADAPPGTKIPRAFQHGRSPIRHSPDTCRKSP